MALALATAIAWVALAVVAAAAVGREPTRNAVCAMAAAASLVFLAIVGICAAVQGEAPRRLVLDVLARVAEPLVSSVGDVTADNITAVVSLMAGTWAALAVVLGSAATFAGCCARYAVDRRNHRLAWKPFSQLDLSVWSVYVLIVGVLLWVVAGIEQLPGAAVIEVVGENVIVVGIVPLFVQGAAAGKGLLDGADLSFTAQVMIGIALWLIGAFAIAVPLIGLLDFWANFRKLPRDEELEKGA